MRALTSLDELERIKDGLPAEAFEALYWLGEGESLEEVERAMAVSLPEAVDPGDFEAALRRDATKRRFVLVEDDAALEAMLEAPLEKWRVFLHPSQRQLVHRSWNGPVRVLGGAGTGKTVVAMHRAVHLAQSIFTRPEDRILFTTFTRNLAADIGAHLDALCPPEARRRIDVVHLDQWVGSLLKRAGYAYDIAWWEYDGKLAKLWEQSRSLAPSGSFDPGFYREEWELVVQPSGCETWEDYRKASRAGRGVRLSRGQRKEVWPVFEEYRDLLEKERLREPENTLRDAAMLIDQGKLRVGVRAIVVDEAQDMSTHAFALFRKALGEERPDDLFLVGDGHQRINRKRVVLSRAGVNIRGRGRRLRINYRTTDEIRRHAVALLEGQEVDDLDGDADSVRGYRSLMHGDPPEVRSLTSFDQEIDAILAWLGDVDLSQACLVARTNERVDRYAQALEKKGVQVRRVQRSQPDDPRQPGLRVATMHRVKGLEFDRVIVAGATADAIPLRSHMTRSADPAVKRDAELMERALLYVALTRARRAVLITAHDEASPWIAR